jgi:hypothetical protein
MYTGENRELQGGQACWLHRHTREERLRTSSTLSENITRQIKYTVRIYPNKVQVYPTKPALLTNTI